MKLNYRRNEGVGEPVLILHGLFGSLGNWGFISRQLAGKFAVIGVDLRNHGASPHSQDMAYPAMAADVLELMDGLGLESGDLVGHSMGGKVAMELALSRPRRVKRLVVVDIAPVTYSGRDDSHLPMIAAMEALPLDRVKNRKEADARLAGRIEDAAVRQFILTNLVRNEDGGYRWRLNLAAIKRHYDKLRRQPSAQGPFTGPALFVKGALSHYIQPAHEATIKQLFPAAEVVSVAGAGHWVHGDQPQALLTILGNFLSRDVHP